MLKRALAIFILTLGFSCGTNNIDPMKASAESNDFSLLLANGDFATSGFLFYRIRANKAVEEYFEIIPPPLLGEISIRAIGCGDKEYHLSSNGKMLPIPVKFQDLVPFDTWESKEVCEFFISGIFSLKINKETHTEIANAFVKVVVFDEDYEPLTLNSPYAFFKGSYKNQGVSYSTKLRSAVSPKPQDGRTYP